MSDISNQPRPVSNKSNILPYMEGKHHLGLSTRANANTTLSDRFPKWADVLPVRDLNVSRQLSCRELNYRTPGAARDPAGKQDGNCGNHE